MRGKFTCEDDYLATMYECTECKSPDGFMGASKFCMDCGAPADGHLEIRFPVDPELAKEAEALGGELVNIFMAGCKAVRKSHERRLMWGVGKDAKLNMDSAMQARFIQEIR